MKVSIISGNFLNGLLSVIGSSSIAHGMVNFDDYAFPNPSSKFLINLATHQSAQASSYNIIGKFKFTI